MSDQQEPTLTCPECGEQDSTATLDVVGPRGGVPVDGRLSLNDATPVIVVGCNVCSETLAVHRTLDEFMDARLAGSAS